MGQNFRCQIFCLLKLSDFVSELLKLSGKLLLPLLLTLFADVGKFRVIIGIQAAQLIVLIQAAVRGGAF
jgi:hypothetical protein